jgi:hypothetical protein
VTFFVVDPRQIQAEIGNGPGGCNRNIPGSALFCLFSAG